MTRRSAAGPWNTRGASLIEVTLALLVLTFGLLAMLSGSLTAARAMRTAKDLNVVSVAAQNTLDSLKAVGWSGIGGHSGSYTVRGHQVTWDVQGTNPRRVRVVVMRSATSSALADTIVTYVAQ